MNTTNNRPLVRIRADFNARDGYLGILLPDDAPAEALAPGARVILYEPGELQCEAIVRRGERCPWAAGIVEGSIKYPPDENANGE
jgi:hypothetical protein